MTRATFADRVVAWQGVHGRRGLPWQDTRDAYRVWLSEIMLQQTQVATALPYFLRFVAAFPDVQALAAAPLSRVLERWSGLGYYRRAHHLHAAAQRVVAMHGGEFPTDAATLATLPGIGRSTAAAIAAFASGERAAILDGNVKRVLARHAGVEGYPGAPAVAARLWREAEARLPGVSSERDGRGIARNARGIESYPQGIESYPQGIESYTQGMMDLGATVCTRTRPRCGECPVSADCVARCEGRVDTLPSPRPRRDIPRRAVNVLLLADGPHILFERRPATGVWGGLWSLPEAPLDADLARDVAARFALHPTAMHMMPSLTHAFTHFTLTLHPHWMNVVTTDGAGDDAGRCWLTRDAALEAALPAPIKRMLRQLPLAL